MVISDIILRLRIAIFRIDLSGHAGSDKQTIFGGGCGVGVDAAEAGSRCAEMTAGVAHAVPEITVRRRIAGEFTIAFHSMAA